MVRHSLHTVQPQMCAPTTAVGGIGQGPVQPRRAGPSHLQLTLMYRDRDHEPASRRLHDAPSLRAISCSSDLQSTLTPCNVAAATR